jgi:hypothetical protein
MTEALKLLKTAMAVGDLATRAIEASNAGNEAEANEYLRQARARYADARREWDAAGD